MVGKASKKGRGSASLLFVCANKGELGFSPSFTGSNKTLIHAPARGGDGIDIDIHLRREFLPAPPVRGATTW